MHVLIPFIAGQWSLPADAAPRRRPTAMGLNPLHCGAVVASGAIRLHVSPACRVLIPFIAGQWSLPALTFAARCAACGS